MTEPFAELRSISASLGADPLLVQGAGGNTSIKIDGTMWIKASGTWLSDAARKDIFVPLDIPSLTAALLRDDPECESCTAFVRQDLNTSGLRPSIETSVHGLMRQRVVLHVHCVNTIAWMILENAKQAVAGKMQGLDWAFVPYARPGLHLSRAIREVIRPETSVLLLQNHGLVVAGDTVAEATQRLREVIDRLRREPAPVPSGASEELRSHVPAGYHVADDARAHGIAFIDWAIAAAGSNVYYPDHAVFLGTHIPQKADGASTAILIPGKGVLVKDGAKPVVEAMLGCLAEVFCRLSPGDRLKPLTRKEIGALLNWDAEKYRQSLKQA